MTTLTYDLMDNFCPCFLMIKYTENALFKTCKSFIFILYFIAKINSFVFIMCFYNTGSRENGTLILEIYQNE